MQKETTRNATDTSYARDCSTVFGINTMHIRYDGKVENHTSQVNCQGTDKLVMIGKARENTLQMLVDAKREDDLKLTTEIPSIVKESEISTEKEERKIHIEAVSEEVKQIAKREIASRSTNAEIAEYMASLAACKSSDWIDRDSVHKAAYLAEEVCTKKNPRDYFNYHTAGFSTAERVGTSLE